MRNYSPVRRILAAYECETEQIIKALNITKCRSSVRVQKNRGEVWGEGKYEFKGCKCLSSNGHYSSMAYLFIDIFDFLDSQ